MQLGFKPEYDATEIFDPSDLSNYQGPPLPSRYNGIVYLYDWHLPGKEKRRKRRHRKTHGRIGFQELSLKIADAWKTVDDETRTFCAELCDTGMSKYRRELRDYKLANGSSKKKTDANASAIKLGELDKNPLNSQPKLKLPQVTSSSSLPQLPALKPPQEDPHDTIQSVNTATSAKFIPTDRCSLFEVDAAFTNDMALDLNLFDETKFDFNSSGRETPESEECMVDLDDDAIIDLWKREEEQRVQDDGSDDTVPVLTTNVRDVPKPLAKRAVVSLPSFSGMPVQASQVSLKRNESFSQCLPSQQSDFNQQEVSLLDQQIRMQSSLIAAMAGYERGLAGQ